MELWVITSSLYLSQCAHNNHFKHAMMGVTYKSMKFLSPLASYDSIGSILPLETCIARLGGCITVL